MGLHLDRKMTGRTVHRHWFVPAGITVLSFMFATGGATAREWLKYDRVAIGSGEVWRLLSGHFVHLGWPHLGLNLAGLVLVWALVGSRLSVAVWIGVIAFAVAFISTGFWFVDENLIWYVGLSGLLHGLLITGACAGLTRWRAESLAILVLVFAKVAYEQMAGPMPGSELTSGGPVVVNAHLYGAIAGLVAGLPIWHRATQNAAI
jgi:rhomboid family GlyGly-CTERM serine protease